MGIIVIFTGIVKLFSVFSNAKILEILDPVTGLSYSMLMLLVGIVEAFAGIFVIKYRRMLCASLLLLWLALNILLYKLIFWYQGFSDPCPCLGNVIDYIGIDPDFSENIAFVILMSMISVSVLGILSNKFSNSKFPPKAKSLIKQGFFGSDSH